MENQRTVGRILLEGRIIIALVIVNALTERAVDVHAVDLKLDAPVVIVAGECHDRQVARRDPLARDHAAARGDGAAGRHPHRAVLREEGAAVSRDGGGICWMEDDPGTGGPAGHPGPRVVVVEVRLDQERLVWLEQDRDPRMELPIERLVLRGRHQRPLREVDGEGAVMGRVLRLSDRMIEVHVMALAVQAHLDAVDLQRLAAREPAGVAELLLAVSLHVADIRVQHDRSQRCGGCDRRRAEAERNRGENPQDRTMGAH